MDNTENFCVPGNWRGRGRKTLADKAEIVKAESRNVSNLPADVQEERRRLLESAEFVEPEEKLVVLPKVKRAECRECRWNKWVWMVDINSLQKLVVDCPVCGSKNERSKL